MASGSIFGFVSSIVYYTIKYQTISSNITEHTATTNDFPNATQKHYMQTLSLEKLGQKETTLSENKNTHFTIGAIAFKVMHIGENRSHTALLTKVDQLHDTHNS
jgi:hypothetical protein